MERSSAAIRAAAAALSIRAVPRGWELPGKMVLAEGDPGAGLGARMQALAAEAAAVTAGGAVGPLIARCGGHLAEHLSSLRASRRGSGCARAVATGGVIVPVVARLHGLGLPCAPVPRASAGQRG